MMIATLRMKIIGTHSCNVDVGMLVGEFRFAFLSALSHTPSLDMEAVMQTWEMSAGCPDSRVNSKIGAPGPTGTELYADVVVAPPCPVVRPRVQLCGVRRTHIPLKQGHCEGGAERRPQVKMCQVQPLEKQGERR